MSTAENRPNAQIWCPNTILHFKNVGEGRLIGEIDDFMSGNRKHKIRLGYLLNKEVLKD